MKQYTIINESCLDAMDKMEENSIDCIITDPPYEIGFMNKGWDNTGIAFSVDTWKKALRVLKQGGYLLAFNHSRTFHRMAVAIEDAGFEIRDTIMWLYGSGFPKSHNISKAIDKKLGFEREIVGKKDEGELKRQQRFKEQDGRKQKTNFDNVGYITTPSSNEAKQWDGWGTALKPAYEPIIMARKPIVESITNNVLKYGVGGINIDECRVGDEERTQFSGKGTNGEVYQEYKQDNAHWETVNGRFPSNIIIDGSDEVVSGFPDTKGSKGSGLTATPSRSMFNSSIKGINRVGYDDDGSASRFFYTAKASKKDRDEGLDDFASQNMTELQGRKIGSAGAVMENGKQNPYASSTTIKKNIHPTVKPTDLMQYLVRLVAPKGATILDIFMGSGSTGKACMLENVERNANYHFIGIDLEKEYCDIAKARIDWAINYKDIEIEKSEKRVVEGKEAKQLSIFEI